MLGTLPCLEYIGFDDRRFIVIGILIISIVLFPVFSGVEIGTYYQHVYAEVPEGIVLTSFFWIFYRGVSIELRRMYPKMEQTRKRIWILTLIMIFSAPIIGKLLSGITHIIISSLGGQDCLHMGFWREIVATYFLSFSVLATYEAIYFFYKYRDAIKEKERLQTAHVQSELDNLRNQINPHFLFNSLNTVMNIIPKDQGRAISYLNKLSKFYRYSVGKHEDSLVLIEEEIKNAMLYSDLLKERFGDNINISFQNGISLGAKVIPLSLQLLIENAIKHNIVSKKKPLNVEVFVSEDKEYIHIKNNLQKKIQEVSSTGVGLNNITKRFAYFTDKEVKILEEQNTFEVAIPIISDH